MICEIKLDGPELTAKSLLEERLKQAVADYNSDISDANDLIEKANDKVEAARQKLNAVLADVEKFREEVATKLEAFWDGKSEDWQYSPEGKAFAEWKDHWGFDATGVQDNSRDKFDELDDGTDMMLSDVPNGPKTC